MIFSWNSPYFNQPIILRSRCRCQIVDSGGAAGAAAETTSEAGGTSGKTYVRKGRKHNRERGAKNKKQETEGTWRSEEEMLCVQAGIPKGTVDYREPT